MSRYTVGDKVRLIDNFEQGRIYYMRGLSNRPGVSVTIKWSLEERKKLAGKIVTIAEVGEYYRIEEDSHYKIWTDDMFVGMANPFTCRSLL